MTSSDPMRALTLAVSEDGQRHLSYNGNYPKPEAGRGEVLIQVILAGICGTDLEILKGYKDLDGSHVLGHEFVGKVISFGPDCPQSLYQNIKLNDRVVAEINCVPFGCTTAVTAQQRAQSPQRTAIGIFGRDGAFADFLTVPFENLHRVPDEIPTRAAVFTEPVAAACQILEQLHIPTSSSVAVLGAGKLGCIVAKVLATAGKDVTMLTRRSVNDVPIYVRHWGPADDHLVSILSIADLDFDPSSFPKFDTVVDCTGDPQGFETAVHLVKPRGTVVLKSTANNVGGTCHIDLTPVVVNEVHVIGSRCGPFDVALRFMANGFLDVDSLIAEVFPMERGIEAVEYAKRPGTLKVLLQCSALP